jgi:hypothetical protein
MRIVHEFRIEPKKNVNLKLPRPSRILHVGMQGMDMFVWALLPLEATKAREVHRLRILTTGEPMDAEEAMQAHYVGTVTTRADQTWHVFELPPTTHDDDE